MEMFCPLLEFILEMTLVAYVEFFKERKFCSFFLLNISVFIEIQMHHNVNCKYMINLIEHLWLSIVIIRKKVQP